MLGTCKCRSLSKAYYMEGNDFREQSKGKGSHVVLMSIGRCSRAWTVGLRPNHRCQHLSPRRSKLSVMRQRAKCHAGVRRDTGLRSEAGVSCVSGSQRTPERLKSRRLPQASGHPKHVRGGLGRPHLLKAETETTRRACKRASARQSRDVWRRGPNRASSARHAPPGAEPSPHLVRKMERPRPGALR